MIVYVSHRLGEIEEFCSRVVAMRDGRIAGELHGDQITRGRMVQLVSGRADEFEPKPVERPRRTEDIVVRARGLSGIRVKDLDIEISRGEVLGIGGLFGVGAGFLLTPLLIFTGIPSAVAVGTGSMPILASSVSGAIAQYRRNNVDIKMGIVLVAGGQIGQSGQEVNVAVPQGTSSTSANVQIATNSSQSFLNNPEFILAGTGALGSISATIAADLGITTLQNVQVTNAGQQSAANSQTGGPCKPTRCGRYSISTGKTRPSEASTEQRNSFVAADVRRLCPIADCPLPIADSSARASSPRLLR